MDSQLRDSAIALKIAEIQNTATEIAVEFRQVLGYVEARNINPSFDYAHIKAGFEKVSASLATRLTALQTHAQGTDIILRDKCQQLAKLLRSIVEDVRQELIASSPAPSDPHAQPPAAGNNLAARLQRSTTEAVTLIKSVLSAAQGTSPAASPSLSPIPLPTTSSSTQRSNFVPHSPMRGSTSSPARHTLTRTNSSPTSLRDSARAMSLSSPAASPSFATASDNPISPVANRQLPPTPTPTPSPLSPLSPSPSLLSPTVPAEPLSAGMHRSTSLPHHTLSPQPFNLSTPVSNPSTSSRRSVGPRKAPSVAVTLLVDGTLSHPHPPSHNSAMILVIDKRKDPALAKLVRCVLDSISWITDVSLKSKMLAFFVGSAMGKVPVGDFDVCRNCANNFTQLREKYAQDPCPLGEISHGYARHRALLYKYLADSMSLPARIHTHASALRAPDAPHDAKESAHAHASTISVVEVYIEAEKKWCVVDLVKEVGELYDEGSTLAQEYKQTGIEWEDEQPLPAVPPALETLPPAPDTIPSKEALKSSGSSSSPSSSPNPSPPTSEIRNPSSEPTSGAKANGDTPEPPHPPSKPSAKARARSTTAGLPARPHRHSAYAGSHAPSLAKPGAAKLAASGGRVLRLPVENSEIILNERVGKGTFGDVYRCRISGYTCAVKIVNIKSLSEAALKMMHNEIYFLETLSHENIIGFLGHEEVPRREIKIFMEYMPLNLANIIQKRNSTAHHFNKKDLIKCAKGMAEAISYLHHRKIIHRDIKSSNVLLEIDNTLDRIQEVRLCDFGVSKLTETASAITFTGTNLWVAPEVFDVQFGIASNYDEKCDIWSFGMVLVEMVTLNPPYYGLNTQEATQNIRNGIPPSLEVNPDIEESILNLIYTCLKKVPSERPSADDILSMINQL